MWRKENEHEADGTKEPGGMHGLRRVREHMPEAGDHHAAGRGGISVSEGGRGKVHFLRPVRKALPGGAALKKFFLIFGGTRLQNERSAMLLPGKAPLFYFAARRA